MHTCTHAHAVALCRSTPLCACVWHTQELGKANLSDVANAQLAAATRFDDVLYRRGRELQRLDAAFYTFASATLPPTPDSGAATSIAPAACEDGCGHVCPGAKENRWSVDVALRRLCSDRSMPRCSDGTDLAESGRKTWPLICNDFVPPTCPGGGSLLLPIDQIDQASVPSPCEDGSTPMCHATVVGSDGTLANETHGPKFMTMPPECRVISHNHATASRFATCDDLTVPPWGHEPITEYMPPTFGPRERHGRFFYERYELLFGHYNESHTVPAPPIARTPSGGVVIGREHSSADACVANPFAWLPCCPSPFVDDDAPCGGLSRGRCVHTAQWLRDRGRPGKARPFWWLGVGIYRCECTGNFAGFDCGMCKRGWVGPSCDVRAIKRRLPLHYFHKAAAIRRLLAGNVFQHVPRWMFLKTYHQANDWSDYSIYSLHWHRAFLMWIENWAVQPLRRPRFEAGALGHAVAQHRARLQARISLAYWNVTDPREVAAVEELLGYETAIRHCGNATWQARCPTLLGGGAWDCHCLPREAQVQRLLARPCFGPLDDPNCFFAGASQLHLAAHYLTGLGRFGFHFDTTASAVFVPIHAYLDVLFQRWGEIHGLAELNRSFPTSTLKMELREEARVSGVAVSEADVAPFSHEHTMPLVFLEGQPTFADMVVSERDMPAKLGYEYLRRGGSADDEAADLSQLLETLGALEEQEEVLEGYLNSSVVSSSVFLKGEV